VVAERARHSDRDIVKGTCAFAQSGNTASIYLAVIDNANQICHSPSTARIFDARLRLALAGCKWMHLGSRRAVAAAVSSSKRFQDLVPIDADLPIMTKDAGVEVKRAPNSGSSSLAQPGLVAAWSMCILTLHVPTKASEQNTHHIASNQPKSLRVLNERRK